MGMFDLFNPQQLLAGIMANPDIKKAVTETVANVQDVHERMVRIEAKLDAVLASLDKAKIPASAETTNQKQIEYHDANGTR